MTSDVSAAQQDVPLMQQAQPHSLSEGEQTGELIYRLYESIYGDKLNYWNMHILLRIYAGKILVALVLSKETMLSF